eukprot:scaffold9793_cov56-Attheya_sp.AAC.1
MGASLVQEQNMVRNRFLVGQVILLHDQERHGRTYHPSQSALLTHSLSLSYSRVDDDDNKKETHPYYIT